LPRPSQKSRSKRHVKTRTPGGRVVVHYERRHRAHPRCAWCGGVLRGVPREGHNKYSKSERTVERIYGGYLCHRCVERSIKHAIHAEWAS